LTVIKNLNTIVSNATSPLCAEARKTVLELVDEAISAVDPRNLIRNNIRQKENTLTVGELNIDLSRYDRIIVAGAGKASGAMAEALEGQLGERIDSGIVNIPRGTASGFKTSKIKLQEAGHPIPDEGGLEGTKRIVALLTGLDDRTLVFFSYQEAGPPFFRCHR